MNMVYVEVLKHDIVFLFLTHFTLYDTPSMSVNDSTLFLFVAEEYSIVYMYNIFFIYFSINGHLGCFHVLAIVNISPMNIEVHVSLWIMAFYEIDFCSLTRWHLLITTMSVIHSVGAVPLGKEVIRGARKLLPGFSSKPALLPLCVLLGQWRPICFPPRGSDKEQNKTSFVTTRPCNT